MTNVAEVRRWLAEIPELFALTPLFTGLTSGTGERTGSGNPSRPPVSLDLVDLTDTRAKADADPYRADAALDRMPHRWRDGQGRMVESPGSPRLGPLEILAGWCRATSDALWDAGVTHDELGVEACTALCDEAPVRARRARTLGPCSGDARDHRLPATVAGECSFLLEHLDWIIQQQWSSELLADLRQMRRRLRDAVHEVDPPALVCTVPGCGWGVADEGDVFRCTGCGKATGRIEAWRSAVKMQPKTIQQCADHLKVTVRTLRKLVAAKDVRHVAAGEGKTLLYDVRDFSAALARVRLMAVRRIKV